MRSALPYYVIGFIVLIGLFLILGPRLTQGNLPGQANEVIGKVEIKPAAGGDWRILQLGEQISHGDVLRTGVGATLNLFWYGGSHLRLGEKTQMSITHAHINNAAKTADLQVDLTQGKIWVRTRKSVAVITKVEIDAQKTSFKIKHSTLLSLELQPEAQTRLEVYTGRCEIVQGQTRVIVADSKIAILSPSGLTQEPRPMNAAEINAWLTNTQITGAFLTVLTPQEGEKVAASLLSLSGYTDPGNTVQIEASNGGAVNATAAKVEEDGKWSAKLALVKGETNLRVTAVDDEGRQSFVLRKVSY